MNPNQAADHLASLAASLDLAPPMQEGASTPDVVSAVWWLTLPRKQACLELGINEADYPIVHRGVEKVVALWENRKAQGNHVGGAPLIKRRKTRRTAALHRGGRIIRIKV